MKKAGWVAVLGTVVGILPVVLAAQMDPNGSQGTASQSGSQPAAGSTMRETLGAPGVRGQQLADQMFVRSAVESGLADVKLGHLAVEKGGVAVKTLGQTLVDDHSAINKEMETIADSLGVQLPKKMSKDDQVEYEKLSKLSGKEFDAEYLPFIAKAHWTHMHDFYMEASVAADSGLAAEVVKAMMTMREHLGKITKTAEQEGITMPARPPRPPRPDGGPRPDGATPPPPPPPPGS